MGVGTVLPHPTISRFQGLALGPTQRERRVPTANRARTLAELGKQNIKLSGGEELILTSCAWTSSITQEYLKLPQSLAHRGVRGGGKNFPTFSTVKLYWNRSWKFYSKSGG